MWICRYCQTENEHQGSFCVCCGKEHKEETQAPGRPESSGPDPFYSSLYERLEGELQMQLFVIMQNAINEMHNNGIINSLTGELAAQVHDPDPQVRLASKLSLAKTFGKQFIPASIPLPGGGRLNHAVRVEYEPRFVNSISMCIQGGLEGLHMSRRLLGLQGVMKYHVVTASNGHSLDKFRENLQLLNQMYDDYEIELVCHDEPGRAEKEEAPALRPQDGPPVIVDTPECRVTVVGYSCQEDGIPTMYLKLENRSSESIEFKAERVIADGLEMGNLMLETIEANSSKTEMIFLDYEPVGFEDKKEINHLSFLFSIEKQDGRKYSVQSRKIDMSGRGNISFEAKSLNLRLINSKKLSLILKGYRIEDMHPQKVIHLYLKVNNSSGHIFELWGEQASVNGKAIDDGNVVDIECGEYYCDLYLEVFDDQEIIEILGNGKLRSLGLQLRMQDEDFWCFYRTEDFVIHFDDKGSYKAYSGAGIASKDDKRWREYFE